MAASFESAGRLWERAFQQLERDEATILEQNERQFADLNRILIDKALFEIQSKQWCIPLAGKRLRIRELGSKIVNFIGSSQGYLQQVTSTEPHAALAWTCVSLLLPLITNQSSQEEEMLAGLDEVSYLIGLYTAWQSLYASIGTESLRDNVVKLYSSILTYQARLLHYLSRGSMNKFARNAIQKDGWEDWLKDVRRCERRCVEHAKLVDVSQERDYRSSQGTFQEAHLKTTEHILDALNEIQQKKLQQVSDTERKELVHCLSSDYRSQKDSNPERVEGTCKWFVQDERFIDWRDSPKSCLLHVFAGPGCGKSVLARYLIDSETIKALDSATVLYFFFKSAQEGQEKSADALAAMLHQLYTQKQSEGMVVHALPRYKAHGNKLSTMFGELWDVLQRTIEDPTAGEVICVFDALDECLEQDRRVLLTAMTTYFEGVAPRQSSGGCLKVLVTSRPYEDIGIEYNRMTEKASVVQLDGSDKSELIAKEINLVIKYAVPRSLPTLGHDLQRTIIRRLQNMENRTYLWLHFILDHLEKNSAGKRTPRKIEKLIATLPATVNEAYQEMLRRSKDPEQARTLLHLVVAAKRRLTVAELKIAVALVDDEEYESYEELCGETETNEQFKNSLQNICGLILSVHDSRVYLIHQTAREYLCSEQFEVESGQKRWQGPITEGESDALTAKSCVSLLSLKDFSEPQPWMGQSLDWYEIGDRIDKWVQQYDLLEYASIYWASHNRYRKGTEGGPEIRQQMHLCMPDSEHFWTWYPIFCKNQDRDLSSNFNGLAFSSFMGNEKLVDSFLLGGADVNSYDKRDGNALQAASAEGHDKIVQLLLDRGAEVNAEGGRYGNALQAASFGGHDKIVQLLLDRGAEVNAEGEGYGNALQAASFRGHDKIVQLLLDRGAEVNAEGGEYGNALQAASVRGHDKIVQLLLDRGAEETIRIRD